MIKVTIKNKMAPELKMRLKRKLRIRREESIFGTAERPRLCVFKSNKYIYAQIVDDVSHMVIVASNSTQKSLKESAKSNKNIDAAKKIGKSIAKKAKEKGIERVIFDRNGYPYQGKIKALADAAREVGLKF